MTYRQQFRRLLFLVLVPACPVIAAEPFELEVMTFNVLVEISTGEGTPRWKDRRDELVQLIRESNPDLIGLQEPTPRQADYITQMLERYDRVDVDRYTDVVLLYRRDLFELVDQGHWWLSPTPDKPRSRGFGNFLPRLLIWAQLRHQPSGQDLLVANTHFDNTAPSQEKMAALCQERFLPLAERKLPMIWMGDFNTDQNRGDYETLISSGWRDSYTVSPLASPGGRDDNAPTFPGSGARRIDHIFYHGPITPISWQVIHYPDADRPLSDHYPVQARLKVAGAP